MNEKEPEKKEQKFLHFSDRIARRGVESDDVGEICVGVGNYLDDARTAMLRYYDDAMNRAKFEKNAKATVDSLVKARNIIGLAIETLEKVLCQDEAKEESNPVVAEEEPSENDVEEVEVVERIGDEIGKPRVWGAYFEEFSKSEQINRLMPYEKLAPIFDEMRRRIDREKPERLGELLRLLHLYYYAALRPGKDDRWVGRVVVPRGSCCDEYASDSDCRGMFLRAILPVSDVAKACSKAAIEYEERLRNCDDPADATTTIRKVLKDFERLLYCFLPTEARDAILKKGSEERAEARRIFESHVSEEVEEEIVRSYGETVPETNTYRRVEKEDGSIVHIMNPTLNFFELKDGTRLYIDAFSGDYPVRYVVDFKESEVLFDRLRAKIASVRRMDDLLKIFQIFAYAAIGPTRNKEDQEDELDCLGVERYTAFPELSSYKSARGLFRRARVSIPDVAISLNTILDEYANQKNGDGTVVVGDFLEELDKHLYHHLSRDVRKVIAEESASEWDEAVQLYEDVSNAVIRKESEKTDTVKNDQGSSEDSRGLVSEEAAKEILKKISFAAKCSPVPNFWTLIIDNLICETFALVKPYPDATVTFEEYLWYCASMKGTNNWREADESPRREDGILTKEEAEAILDQRVTQRLWRCESEDGPHLPYFVPYDNDKPVPWEVFVGMVVWEMSKIVELSDNDIRDTILWTRRLSYTSDFKKCENCHSVACSALCSDAFKGALDAWVYGLAHYREIARPKLVKELVKHFCEDLTRETSEIVVKYCKSFYSAIKADSFTISFATKEFLSGSEAASLAESFKNAIQIRPNQWYSHESVVLNAIKHVYVGRNITEEEWNEILTELVSDE